MTKPLLTQPTPIALRSMGVKQGSLEAGGATIPVVRVSQRRYVIRRLIKWLGRRLVAPASALGSTAKIEMLGFYHTLRWDTYQLSDTTSVNVGTGIANMLSNASYSSWNSSHTAGNGNGVFFLMIPISHWLTPIHHSTLRMKSAMARTIGINWRVGAKVAIRPTIG